MGLWAGLRPQGWLCWPGAEQHRRASLVEHAPQNAMEDPDEIERFYDRCSDLMRGLFDGLAAAADRPRPFPEIEDAIGWPQRRIASRRFSQA